jgi:putative NADH-flavin reductase
MLLPITIRSLFCAVLLLLPYPVPAGEAADAARLKMLVYGASGKVGSHVVQEALDRGHLVTAVSRDPSRIRDSHHNLSIVQGDVLDPVSVRQLTADQDVIIVSVRGVVGKSRDANEAVTRIAVENVINALRTQKCNAGRLIHVGGSGSLKTETGVLYADTLPKALLPRELEVEIAGQVLALEFLRSVKDVDWTYATPAKYFTNGKRTGHFRITGDQLLEDPRGRSRISRADFAVALIDEAENRQFIRQRFSVVY